MPTQAELKAHLTRQIGFLTRSAEAYDAGNVEEAVRIATGLRVLFHQTRSSTSLMTLMGSPEVELLSQLDSENVPCEQNPGYFQALCRIDFAGGFKMGPVLDLNRPYRHYLPLPEWKEEFPLGIGGKRVSRWDLVKVAANKDGGAHVDDPPPEYAALQEALLERKDGEPDKLHDVVYPTIRSIAFEVLHSPALIKMAE